MPIEYYFLAIKSVWALSLFALVMVSTIMFVVHWSSFPSLIETWKKSGSFLYEGAMVVLMSCFYFLMCYGIVGDQVEFVVVLALSVCGGVYTATSAALEAHGMTLKHTRDAAPN
ncbi:MAG: hypothetical protein RLZZ234_883 [Candidatus Parcubacteria bacterium]|jgi:hypothetical protein